jgi:UDP-N-acetylmuramate-alanine ligase
MSERHLPDRTLLPATGASVYLLGIAGAGMSGLAMLLAAEGYLVTGADRELTPETDRLRDLGVRLWPETATQPAVEAELVVYTSAVAPGHPVLAAARTAGVSSLKRARAMGALLNARRLVAVGGTHGKTTVTAMTARIAEAGGLDPIALVGGRVAAWNGNARAGAGVVAVAEADEYDRSFLELDPSLAVVTSVEPEHMECYDGPSDLVAAFREFAGRASERDGILACAEGPGIPETLRGLGGVHTYGLGPAADYRVEVVARDGARQTCRFTGQRTPERRWPQVSDSGWGSRSLRILWWDSRGSTGECRCWDRDVAGPSSTTMHTIPPRSGPRSPPRATRGRDDRSPWCSNRTCTAVPGTWRLTSPPPWPGRTRRRCFLSIRHASSPYPA